MDAEPRRLSKPSSKLLVSDLHPDVSRELLESYFESRNVEVVEASPFFQGKCIVSITSEMKVIKKFCAKNHRIKGHLTKVESLPDEVVIEVDYPSEAFDQDTLGMYFTGPASGERDDEEDKAIEWIRIIEPGRCRIKFESFEDIACILKKKSHTFRKKEMIVTLVQSLAPPTKLELLPHNPDLVQATPPTDMPLSLGGDQYATNISMTTLFSGVVVPLIERKGEDKYERNKLIITNIPEGVDDAYFEVFLDGQLELETDNSYSVELLKTGAILTFAKEYSIEELNNFCELIMSGKLKGEVIVAELCKTNCTVLIKEITKESFASQDSLEMYFGSKKSGGGKNVVEKVVMLDRKKAKVTFKSSQTITSVLSKDHSTLGPNVKMVACSPIVDMEDGNNEELCDDPPLSSPTEKRKKSSSAAKLNLDLLIAKYLGNHAQLLNNTGKEVNATVSVVDRNNGIIELVMNDIDASPDDLQSAVTQFNSLVSSTVRRADIHFPPEANADASKAIVNFSSANNLPVDFTGNDCIGVAGKVHQIDDLEKMVHDLCSRIVLASEQIPLSSEDCMYYSKYAIEVVKKSSPRVKIGLNASTNVLSVSGSRRDVTHFKESLSGLIQHATVPVQVSKLGMEFLKSNKGAGILNTLIKSDGVFPFFSEDPYGNVTLSLLCPHDHAQHAETISAKISATILEKELKFPQYFYTDVADSPQFNNFKQRMSDKYAFLCSVEQNGQVFKLVCRDEVQKQLSDTFCKFVTEECSITERIQMKRGVWRLLNTVMGKKWNKLQAEMMENGIKVLGKSKPTASRPFLKIKGERNVMAQMKEKFMELQKSVHEFEFTVAHPIVQHFYKDPHGQVSLTGIESRAKVCIELEVQKDDVESDTSTPTGKGSGSFKKVCTANTHGVTVNLYTGDITQFNKAEVIVNAANEGLSHGAGIAGAIVDRGGPIISKDSQDYVSKRGKVPTGSAVLFHRVGNLLPPYQAIVHAVGPTWYNGSSKDRNIALLRKTIKNTLKKAKAFNSIAIPAISSGVFGFPVDVCANSLVQAVLEFISGNSDCNLNEINFVIFDDNVPAFKQAMKDYLHMFDESQPSVLKTTPTTSQSSPQMSLQSFIKRSSSRPDATTTTYNQFSPHDHINRFFGYSRYSSINPNTTSIGVPSSYSSQINFDHKTLDEDILSSSNTRATTMYIYGESDEAVKRAEKMLRGIVDTLIVNEEIDDENITELSSTVLNDLEELAKQNNVEIDIDSDSDLHSIKLHGCQNDVLKVKEKVKDALNHVHHFKAKKEVASTVSKHFKWVRQLSDGPEDYNEIFSYEIERAFQQKKPSYQHYVEGDRFTVDFSKMEETDLDNGEKVKVTRVDFAEAFKKPPEWVAMPKDSNNREVTVHLVTLKQSDAEYKMALSKFGSTMNSSQIVSIQRIQNPVLYGQYMARKKEMVIRNPPVCQNERWLFHGTKPSVIDAINTQGLNRSFKSTTMYGQGVYFVRDASRSHRYALPDPSNNHRRMYLARVLTGEFTVGNQSMIVPPAKNAQNQRIVYDSTVDNTSKPSIFVVYQDPQSYPAYLITYK